MSVKTSPRSLRKNLFALRQTKRDRIVRERCLSCVHYKQWSKDVLLEHLVDMVPRDMAIAQDDRGGKVQDGSCLLLGGLVTEWHVCNKYRGE